MTKKNLNNFHIKKCIFNYQKKIKNKPLKKKEKNVTFPNNTFIIPNI